ncbi:DUF2029 domain-containing protein [bacterium]|nr:DUF2029 domain-containing protein [bacterium]
MTMTSKKLTDTCAFPVIAIALFLAVSYGLCTIIQLYRFEPMYPLHQFRQSMDLFDYCSAAHQIEKPGGSIYAVSRYVTPPTAALMLYPLIKSMPYRTIRTLLQTFIILSIAASIWLSAKIFLRKNEQIPEFGKRMLYMCLGIIILYSYPVYFIFDRINADWLTLFCVWAGLFFLDREKDIPAGLLLGMSAAIKVYPLLIAVPLVIHRKWKTVCTLFVPFAVFFLIRPEAWFDYVQFRLAERLDSFHVIENVSLANTLFYLSRFLHIPLPRDFLLNSASILWVVLVGVLCAGIVRNRKSVSCLRHIMYLMPCMFLIPSTSYAYSLIFIVPAIPFYISQWQTLTHATLRRVYYMLFCCVALTQIQAVFLEKLFGIQSVHFLPSFGLLGIVLCSIACVYCTHPASSNP